MFFVPIEEHLQVLLVHFFGVKEMVFGVQKLMIPGNQPFPAQVFLQQVFDLVHPIGLVESLRGVVRVGGGQVLEVAFV